MYYPQFRVLNMAEIATQNMHNLLPMRGALVRDRADHGPSTSATRCSATAPRAT